MKSFGKQVPWQNADVACSRVQSGIVNLARNARRLASPRQAYDAGDVVLALAGQNTVSYRWNV